MSNRRVAGRPLPLIDRLERRQLLAATDYDLGFDGDGAAVTPVGAQSSVARAVVVQPDGKILVAGASGHPGTLNALDTLLARYNPDGSLDTTFGTGGIVVRDMSGQSKNDELYGLALQRDGKIVAVGRAEIYEGQFAGDRSVVMRFGADGALDTAFGGGDGMFDVQWGTATAVVVQPSGRIVVGTSIDQQRQFQLIGVRPDGTEDTSFHINGRINNTYASYSQLNTLNAMALQPDGKIVFAGEASGPFTNSREFGVGRLTVDGELDTTFGGTGRFTVPFSGFLAGARGLLVQSDGKIVVSGNAGSHPAIVRLATTGGTDSSMKRVETFTSGLDHIGAGLAIQRDGKPLLSWSRAASGAGAGLHRYTTGGIPDTSFGPLGRHEFSMGTPNRATAADVVVQPDGKIIVVGSAFRSDNVNFDLAVVRLMGDTTPLSNAAPTANPGGPYIVNETADVQLNGFSSFDDDGYLTSWEWDFDYTGTFDVDASGYLANFSALDGPETRTIAVRVTDDDGVQTIATTTVQINDIAPTVTVGGGTLLYEDETLTVTFSATDVGPDTISGWRVAWGDGQSDLLPAGATSAQHDYASGGSYNVIVYAINEDGEHAAPGRAVTVVPTPVLAGDGMLTVHGTAGSDGFSLFASGADYVVNVQGMIRTFALAGVARVDVFGYDGNDTFTCGADARIRTIDAGAGNDAVRLDGPNIPGVTVLGGAGSDSVTMNGTAAAETFTATPGSFIGGGSSVDFSGVESATLFGGDGDDTVNLAAPAGAGPWLQFEGGNGADTLNATGAGYTGNVTFGGGSGVDRFTARAGEFTTLRLIGTGDDLATLTGTDGPDTFSTHYDYVRFNDTTAYATNLRMTVMGGGGDDTFTVDGSPYIFGFFLSGAAGNDTFSIGSGHVQSASVTTVSGGSGSNTATFDDSLQGFVGGSYAVTGNSIGRTNFWNTLVSEIQSLELRTGSANDNITVHADAGRAVAVFGNNGNDTLNLNTATTGVTLGPTTFNGGAGDDTFTYAVNAPATFNGGTGADTLNVNSGTFTFDADAAATTENLRINVANGAAVIFNATQHLAGLSLAAGAAARMTADGDRTLFTNFFIVDSFAALDLTDNDLLVDYTGASPYSMIRALILAGRNTGTRGILFTRGAGDVVLAPVDNATFGRTIFNGEPIDATTVIGKYTYYGDSNLDGAVTGDDYLPLDSNLGVSPGTRRWFHGDFNFDGAVTGDDYLFVDANLGKGTADPLAFADEQAEMIALHASQFGGKSYIKELEAVMKASQLPRKHAVRST